MSFILRSLNRFDWRAQELETPACGLCVMYLEKPAKTTLGEYKKNVHAFCMNV